VILFRTEYDWVSTQLTNQCFKYRWLKSLEYFAASVTMVTLGTEEGMMFVEKCSIIDNVCHGREGNESDFFYMYQFFY